MRYSDRTQPALNGPLTAGDVTAAEHDPGNYGALAAEIACRQHETADGPYFQVFGVDDLESDAHVVALCSILMVPRRRRGGMRTRGDVAQIQLMRRHRDRQVAMILRRLRTELDIEELAIEHHPPLDDLWMPGRCQAVILRADEDQVGTIGEIVQEILIETAGKPL